MAIRVLITDGSPAIRDSIRRHLECMGCSVLAEAESAAQALPLFRTIRPEIVTLDTQLRYGGQPNPFDLVRVIKRESPGTSVLMVGTTWSPEEAELFIRAGALECFVAPFDFASVWRVISVAHPELMAGTYATMMSTTAALKATRASR
ncbi:MAG TPA: response regulator [Candidatus Binataceae bacterium]|nr:response regulator [Candidatus Binataceae bacterium]